MGKKDKEYTEGLKPELLKIAEIEVTDKTNSTEEISGDTIIVKAEELTPPKLFDSPKVKKEKKENPLEKFNPIFYQYTVKRGDNPAIIIYSKNLPKEHKNPDYNYVVIKDAFVESVVTQDFLGFKLNASYKEKIDDYNLLIEPNGGNWMIVTELVVLDNWVLQTKEDVPSILQVKKEELILHLDQMQKDGKIQIKKK